MRTAGIVLTAWVLAAGLTAPAAAAPKPELTEKELQDRAIRLNTEVRSEEDFSAKMKELFKDKKGTAELVKAAGKPAFVLFMGGPQRAPTTYRDARELIEGSEGVEGMGVPVAPVMLTMRAIYHHSTAQGKTAIEAEPDGKAAEEIAALWTWTSERVNLPTSKQGRKKRG